MTRAPKARSPRSAGAYGCEIWDALADAGSEKPTLIIIVTDGVPSEPVTALNRTDIAAGPPILALGVGTVDQDTLTIRVGDRSATRAVAGLALASSTERPQIGEAVLADVRSAATPVRRSTRPTA